MIRSYIMMKSVVRVPSAFLRQVKIGGGVQGIGKSWFSSQSSETTTTKEAAPEQVRFLSLFNLHDNPGAVKKKTRVGRGVGSGRGKTCGRGHKGEKARSGRGIPLDFEGGQTKFWKLLPKRGFHNPHAQPMTPVNLGKIQDYIDMGRLDPNETITAKALVEAGMMNNRGIKYGVKLLADGKERLTSKGLSFEISRASASAIEAVEDAEGSVITVHLNRLALRAHLKPHKFPQGIPKRARPPPRLMPYYRSYRHRGYLSPEIQMRALEAKLGPPPLLDTAAASKGEKTSGDDGNNGIDSDKTPSSQPASKAKSTGKESTEW